MKKWFCLILLIGLSACGSADKVFLGYWKAQGNQFGYLHITQNGSGHLMTVYDNSLWDGTLQTKEFPVTLKDNSLTMDVPMGKAGRDYTFCEQFASVVTPKNISIRKSSLQQAHLIFRRLLIDFG